MNATWCNWRMAGRIAAVALLCQASPVLAGNEAEVAEHLIDLVKIGGNLKTRVRAPVSKGQGAKLAIVQRGGIARALRARSDDEIEVGIDAFDRAYRVHGMAPDEARTWLETSMGNLVILDERHDDWLGSDGATVTLAWSGVERNPLLLDAARDVVVSLARWYHPEFPSR